MATVRALWNVDLLHAGEKKLMMCHAALCAEEPPMAVETAFDIMCLGGGGVGG